ncbi:hypothetical protein KAF25_004205, partial [Fusarium avenaceum]
MASWTYSHAQPVSNLTPCFSFSPTLRHIKRRQEPQTMVRSYHEKAYDVVIVGAGPAGLVIAAWMSVVGIRALLVDENAAAPTGGLADGLDRRSFEVLDMFNLGSAIWKEAHQNVEVSYW